MICTRGLLFAMPGVLKICQIYTIRLQIQQFNKTEETCKFAEFTLIG